MGSYYTLSDETNDYDLIDGSGRPFREIYNLVDHIDTDCEPVLILKNWDYYGYDDIEFDPVDFTAKTVEQDMKTLIKLFFTLQPERKFGPFTVLEWIDTFKRVVLYVRKHPDSVYRSAFYE